MVYTSLCVSGLFSWSFGHVLLDTSCLADLKSLFASNKLAQLSHLLPEYTHLSFDVVNLITFCHADFCVAKPINFACLAYISLLVQCIGMPYFAGSQIL